MLKFKGSWRFTPPADGKWKNQSIPNEAVGDFYDFISKTATQGNRQSILEHFKGYFCNLVGESHVWSTTESWAETDLVSYMERATGNAPLFLEAFYDACKSLSENNPDIFAPDAEIINALCERNNIGYEIQPPNLILKDTETPVLKVKGVSSSEQSFSITQHIQVFLCHATGDKPKIRELYRRLRNDRVDTWLDEENLLPGHEWQIEIPKAVRSSDVVIVCLSKGSITKEGYVQKEIRQALDVADEKPDGTIFIIPLKLEECEVPERLKKWQWVNLIDNNGYERLMRSLEIRAASKNRAYR